MVEIDPQTLKTVLLNLAQASPQRIEFYDNIPTVYGIALWLIHKMFDFVPFMFYITESSNEGGFDNVRP